MGVYINMEKPKECGHCDMFIEHNSICHCYLTGSHITFVGEVADDCPLIEVVTCEECKHLEVINKAPIYAHCHKWDYDFELWQEDTRKSFCSYGERRADE